MTDFNDGYDEILDKRTVEDELRQVMSSLRLRYSDPIKRLESTEFKVLRERLELIEGRIRAELLLKKYI